MHRANENKNNFIFIPAGEKVWIDIVNALAEAGFSPKIWVGDPVHDGYAKANFPNCDVYNFASINLDIDFTSEFSVIDNDILGSKDFFRLKDQVYKIMDRQDDLGIYGRLEREAYFYYVFNFFYNQVYKNDIKLAVFAEGPHSPNSMVIYGICKFLDIPTYHLSQNPLVPLVHIATDLFGTKLKSEGKLSGYNEEMFKTLMADYLDNIKDEIPVPLYMAAQNKSNQVNLIHDLKKYVLAPVYKRLKYANKRFRSGSDYSVYSRTFYDSNKPSLLHELRATKRKRLLRKKYQEVKVESNLDEDYVFVPLHYEPERTSNPDGGHFYNTYDMILALRHFVPLDIKIVLKEHPSQFTKSLHGQRGRSALFYKAVSTLPNIEFVSIDYTASMLIKNALFVATQTGSAALEASILGKKSLIFGTPWFLGAPNLYSYGSLSFEQLVSQSIYTKSKITEYLMDYISEYTLPACVNPSNFNYYVKKYPNQIGSLLDNKQFAKDFASIIVNDLKKHNNKGFINANQ